MGNDFYNNLPKKRMGAGMLLLNEKGEILLVKPSYREHWSIPGGGVEEGESPREACIREVREETGLEIVNIKFLVVGYNPEEGEKTESLQFIFYGGVLNSNDKVKVDGKEITEYKFATIGEAVKLLGGEKRALANALPKCLTSLKENLPVYLEKGKEIT